MSLSQKEGNVTLTRKRNLSPGVAATRRGRSVLVGALAALLVAACQTGDAGTPGVSALPPSLDAGGAVTNDPPAATSGTVATTASPSLSIAPATPRAEPVDPRADGLDLVFGEFAITLEAAVIRPGPVTLVVHNAGNLTHGLEMKLHGGGSGKDREEIETRTFRSGETLRVEADLPPGVYEVECYVGDHDSRGMRTSLEVREDAPLVTSGPGTGAPDTVRIVQFAFVPVSLEVSVGTRVSWVNDDPAPHTVTADAGAFDSGQLDPGGTFTVVLDRPGMFTYHCEIHPTMVGAVVVD
jgi:plastocyanin